MVAFPGDSKGRTRMVNVVRGSVIAMLVALTIGAIVAYFTPAGSAGGEGYFGAEQVADALAPTPSVVPMQARTQ